LQSPVQSAVIHTFRAAFDHAPLGLHTNFTDNFAMELFGGDGKAGQLRDLQAAAGCRRDGSRWATMLHSLSPAITSTRKKRASPIPAGNFAPGTNVTLELNGPAEPLLAPRGHITV